MNYKTECTPEVRCQVTWLRKKLQEWIPPDIDPALKIKIEQVRTNMKTESLGINCSFRIKESIGMMHILRLRDWLSRAPIPSKLRNRKCLIRATNFDWGLSVLFDTNMTSARINFKYWLTETWKPRITLKLELYIKYKIL